MADLNFWDAVFGPEQPEGGDASAQEHIRSIDEAPGAVAPVTGGAPFRPNMMEAAKAESEKEAWRASLDGRAARLSHTTLDPYEDRTTCRWCLNKFDPSLQQRSIAERGALRSHLKMADIGVELVCCDNCWPGAVGAMSVLNGRTVPCADPNEIPNLMLRQLVEGAADGH